MIAGVHVWVLEACAAGLGAAWLGLIAYSVIA